MDLEELDRAIAETEQAIDENESLLQSIKQSEGYVQQMIANLRRELAEQKRSRNKPDE